MWLIAEISPKWEGDERQAPTQPRFRGSQSQWWEYNWIQRNLAGRKFRTELCVTLQVTESWGEAVERITLNFEVTICHTSRGPKFPEFIFSVSNCTTARRIVILETAAV